MARLTRARLSFVFPLILVLSLLTQACTLVGIGLGDSIDRMMPGPYQSREPDQVQLRRQDHVRLIARNGTHVEGRYLGTSGPTQRDPQVYLLVDGENGPARIATTDLRSIGVEVKGRGWLYGGIAGLLIDASIVVAVIIAYNNSHWTMRLSDSNTNSADSP